jgi:hypothetical protein
MVFISEHQYTTIVLVCVGCHEAVCSPRVSQYDSINHLCHTHEAGPAPDTPICHIPTENPAFEIAKIHYYDPAQ